MTEAPIGLLKAIAHPLRYAILEAIADKERNVGEIEGETGITQPTLSQQLSVLRSAGLVETRREAKLVYYSIVPEVLGELIASISALQPEASQSSAAKPNARATLKGAAVFARLD